MRRFYSTFFVGLSLAAGGAAWANNPETIVLNDPAFPFFHSTAMDQPRLYGLLTDGGTVIEDASGPVLIRAFVDTGSSGFVLSNLHTTDEYGVQSLGFDETDYIGSYTNTGIGGEETGSVSRPLGILLYNDPLPTDGDLQLADFDAYGEHNLWVRDAPGTGEVVSIDLEDGSQYPLISPINIVGMPVIEQRVMVMNWLDIPPELEGLLPPEAKQIQTKLLPPGHGDIPGTNITLDLAMQDFVGEPREGETLPSMSRNPLVKNVTISHDPACTSVTADWLFDTGAGSSFVSFTWAKQIGLIPDTYQDLPSFVADHVAADGMVSQIGGIGSEAVTVPILTVNEIRVPAQEGFDIVWENVRVLIFDHPELAELGLQGIFGMNLIGPAATVDASDLGNVALGDDALLLLLLTALSDITPSPFSSVVFEVTGEETGELRLFSDRVGAGAPTFTAWRDGQFSVDELADPEISGPDADPDADGVTNLMEYALGGLPLSSSRDILPTVTLEEHNGAPHLTLTYERIKPADDLTFTVEASSEMGTWSSGGTELVDTIDLGDRERVTVRQTQDIHSANRGFLRLRVDLVE